MVLALSVEIRQRNEDEFVQAAFIQKDKKSNGFGYSRKGLYCPWNQPRVEVISALS